MSETESGSRGLGLRAFNYAIVMTVTEFRDFCLSLMGTTEKMPWSKPEYSGIIVFCVGDKWFGLVDVDRQEFCNLKCDPEVSLDLQDRYCGVRPGWHMNKKHWISVYFGSDVPDSIVRGLVVAAHDAVLRSLPKKKRDEIESATRRLN